MTDLPKPQNQSNSGNTPGVSSILNKEVESGISFQVPEISELTEIGKDIELPKEVINAGVSMHPTVVNIPPQISSVGVSPAGQNVTVGSGTTVTLPLTNDQINEGLKKDVTNSWRWLAEWCIRKIKHIHRIITKKGVN
jgi:hypothetical protein